MPVNITTIGGGAGTFAVLSSLKQHADFNISAIVSVADSGGTAGQIRDQFGILPPGDIRRSIVALAEDTETVRRLFEYRFDEEGTIGGNKIGNILLAALTDITGDFERGVEICSRMFRTRGRVIPVTLEDVHLGVTLEDGTEIIGEKYIDISETNPGSRTHNPSLSISRAFLTGAGTVNPRASEAIRFSDYVIIGPGDLYTSIVANLLCAWMREALAESKARVIYICNAMTKYGETSRFRVEDFVRVIEEYIGDRLDFVIANSWNIRPDIAERYWREEKKEPLTIGDREAFSGKRYKLVERDLVNETDIVRHDPGRLFALILDIVHGYIK